MEDVFGDPAENELEEMRGQVGFTPWDYVEISEEQLKHEVGLWAWCSMRHMQKSCQVVMRFPRLHGRVAPSGVDLMLHRMRVFGCLPVGQRDGGGAAREVLRGVGRPHQLLPMVPAHPGGVPAGLGIRASGLTKLENLLISSLSRAYMIE